jgi:cellulose synthase/poly-beta-1,6-N-acetylglucosamine synthase-like glycosyltransferase
MLTTAAVYSVLLATEPASVLFPVITSALQMDYPQHTLKILVLDDGARDFVQDHVLELQTMLPEAGTGCTLDYIARIKPAQHWAKAGNINHAFIER